MTNSKTPSQCADAVMMVTPLHFGFNPETAVDNEFQHHIAKSDAEINALALAEFDQAVATLRAAGIQVLVLNHELEENVPDAVFPNNWFGTLPRGRAFVFNMAAENRKAETKALPAVQQLLTDAGFHFFDLTVLADDYPDQILEGTGSMILDHVNGVVYAAISHRTDEALAKIFTNRAGFQKCITFPTLSSHGKPFYHTNVMLAIGEKTALLADYTVQNADAEAYAALIAQLRSTHQIVSLDAHQTEHCFAANALQVNGSQGRRWVMSQTAFEALRPDQRAILEADAPIVPLAIPTIETVGGGSARCMLAEVWLS